MSLENGTYQITSVNTNTGHLVIAPYTIPIYPPVWFIVGSTHKTDKELWKVVSTTNGNCLIYSTTHTNAKWNTRGTAVLATEGQSAEFKILPAGDGVYTIGVTDSELVVGLESAGIEQLHLEAQRETPSPSQLWTFTRVEE